MIWVSWSDERSEQALALQGYVRGASCWPLHCVSIEETGVDAVYLPHLVMHKHTHTHTLPCANSMERIFHSVQHFKFEHFQCWRNTLDIFDRKSDKYEGTTWCVLTSCQMLGFWDTVSLPRKLPVNCEEDSNHSFVKTMISFVALVWYWCNTCLVNGACRSCKWHILLVTN